jgi:hypothetical protein
MKLSRLAASLVLAVAGVAAAAEPEPATQPAPGGRLSVEQELVDVGEVPRGETARASFVLRNTGTEPLHILNAKPG